MKEKITDEQARHMVDMLKKKSELIKNFYHRIEKYKLDTPSPLEFENTI